MVLLSIEEISKTLKDEPLFEHVTFGMEEGERIGVVGPNGCGKSTFLKILAGRLPADTGTIANARELTVSVLDQRPEYTAGQNVSDFLLASDHPTVVLLREYHTLVHEHHLDTHASTQKLHELLETIERLHGWEIETRYASYLSELQGPSLDTPMNQLSGGMLKKVALARVLAPKPSLMLLDEPTNHLDIPTIQWLEKFLVQQQCSVILVTHDRYVLDHVCTSIMEFDRGAMYVHPGSYSQFLQRRSDRLSSEQAEQNRLKTVLRRELEWLSRGPKARTGKDSGRKARIEGMQQSLTANENEATAFSSLNRRMGKKVLELEHITKSYDHVEVITDFSHSFAQGERVGLIGPNGSGKTTLLELISGRILADSGLLDVGVNTVFGYYDQLDEPMDPQKTVLEHISEIADVVTMKPGESISAARFLELFGFPVSFHRIDIARLSGGERRRLHLIGVLLKSPNFLLLDEPTNDLDIDTIRRLEDYLLDFSGCALVVSHDRAFLDRVVDTLFVFSAHGDIQEFAGTYSDYENSTEQDIVSAAKQKKQQIQSGPGSRLVQRDKSSGLTFKERRELTVILEEIDGIEKEIEMLESSFSDPEASPDTLSVRTQSYHEKRALLDEKIERWEFLAAKEEAAK
jgi:ATP-binding cassette subfamily F protein uup